MKFFSCEVKSPLAQLQQIPENRRNDLIAITLELKKSKGDVYARDWLSEQLRDVPEPAEVVRKAPCKFEMAFEETESWSHTVVGQMRTVLPPGPYFLYGHLHHYACADMRKRNYDVRAFLHEFFTIAEALYYILGIPKASFYRHLRLLQQLGLIDYRGHCTTVGAFGSRRDGTVFAVKLHPTRDARAKVNYDHLSAQGYRNLEADIAAKRTFWKVRQSNNGGLAALDTLVGLLRWTHSKCTCFKEDHFQPRLLTVSLSSKSGLEAVSQVTQGPRNERGQRISEAAQVTARALGDQHSINFWWRFYDAMVWYVEQGGKDYAQAVHLGLERERTARSEGFARNAAALFISRLKKSGVYTRLMAP